MTEAQQRAATKQFAADWKDRGDEKQETQRFWIELLTKILGIDLTHGYKQSDGSMLRLTDKPAATPGSCLSIKRPAESWSATSGSFTFTT